MDWDQDNGSQAPWWKAHREVAMTAHRLAAASAANKPTTVPETDAARHNASEGL